MLVVQAAYLEHHMKDRERSAIEARRAFRNINAFMASRSPRRKAYRVSEFDLLEQRAFMRDMADSLSAKSISTSLTFVAAAVNWACRDQIIMDGRTERQLRILTHPITVETNTDRIRDIIGAPVEDKPRWIPTAKDIAAFVDAISPEAMTRANVEPRAAEMLFRFVVVAINTWARRGAVSELRRSMINFDLGLVNLNPPGRRQTKKRRPVIPLTDNLRAWVLEWGDEAPVRWYRQDRSDLWDGFREVAATAGVPQLTPHVIRHFMNSRAIALGVPGQERSMWLGHLDRAKGPTTEIYEHATPDFLAAARAATDRIVGEIDSHMKVKRLIVGRGARRISVVKRGAR